MEEKVITKRKLIFIISFIIVLGYSNIEAYAQIEMDSKQEEQVEEIDNSTEDADESQILEYFTVENNTYKVLNPDKDDNIVIFWKCEKLDNLERIIVNNEVEYNGRNFKVNYVYEKAFYSSKTARNIIIDDNLLGFCDSSGNLIKTLNEAFKNQGKLESVDFGSTKVVFGENCFKDCNKIDNVEIPDNMNIMEEYCFDKCISLKNIDLKGIKKFNGPSSFEYCSSLSDIEGFNDEVIELPDKTFKNCKDIEISSLNNITKIGAQCFEYCRALKKDIVTDIKEFGDKCFYDCSFKEVYLKKAEKIGYNAFGNCRSLEKIRFGNPTIPDLGTKIVEGSRVNEWVYPLSYKIQPDYLKFLNKLNVAKVIWYSNYGNKDRDREETQAAKLNELKPPAITRDGYEIEGWYKEPECINKVNMIADLGGISGSDLVIKDPELYAKWINKDNTVKENSSNNPEDVHDSEEGKPSEAEDVHDSEENKPREPEDVHDSEENKPSEPEDVQDPEEDKPSEPEDVQDSGEEDKPSESEDVQNLEEVANPIDPERTDNTNNSNEQNANNKIENLEWVFKERKNNNVQIINNGTLIKIITNNKCIAIYLKRNNKWYLNRLSYGSKGIVEIGGNNTDDKLYYLQDDEYLVVNTTANRYKIRYYEKLI